MREIIIAIDGYSGCGKSTTAKLVAAEIDYSYIDTGAMYRATTLYFLENHVRLTNDKEVKEALDNIDIEFKVNAKTHESETFLNGLNVEKQIRKMRVTEHVSPVSALSAVRDKMVAQQQKMGKKKTVVMDGRDIGTNVFPEAELKFFMTADLTIRAQRRQAELNKKGQRVGLEDIIANLEERDRIDTTRSESPLRKAEDAHLLDTTNLTIEAQVQYIIDHYNRVMNIDSVEN